MVDQRQRKVAAKAFVEAWKNRGNEKEDTHTFWLELLRDVVGMEDVTTAVRFEQRTVKGGYIDVVIADAKTFIEQKSFGISLDKKEVRQGHGVTPFEQAKAYADTMPNSQRPDKIIVCDFNEFRIHDLNSLKPTEDFISFSLSELPDQIHLLNFLIDPQKSRLRREEQVSIDAGALIGKLHENLLRQFHDPESIESQHNLNVLCVRLVFCLFAEDAGLFPKDAFFHYLEEIPSHRLRPALKDLFQYLNTPDNQRDPYADDLLKAFPYVNGGLFAEPSEIPPFTDEIKHVLLKEVSQDTNWSGISPTIFGGVFESTLNPETRHSGGMHYTSPENIHKVIDPLFLDDLTEELNAIIEEPGLTERKRRNRLNKFHDKISSLTFFDPACGSGNFLTETYIALRRIENQVLNELSVGQFALGLDDIGASPVKVSLRQFYGLEINDFAVKVAETALWIAELQANIETETIVTRNIEDLPLRESATIVRGNALKADWDSVLPPSQCTYVIGNPPFLGARNQSKDQKEEIKNVFAEIGGARNIGNVDYVAGWYAKSASYMADTSIQCAFVSTNSICQGEQVANIWHPIYALGVRINFAHDTFRWINKSADQANVFCVIVGFSGESTSKRLYHYENPDAEPEIQYPKNLNAYLADAPDAFVWNRSTPLSDVPKIGIGNKPIDGGNYLFTADEKEGFLVIEPAAEPYFRRWYGSQEFIRGTERWALWVGDANPREISKMPAVLERVRAVRDLRLASKSAPTRKIADKPTRFHVENMPQGNSILVPKVSSERRRYIPLGMVGPENLCSDLVFLIPNASLYHFGILHSQFHNAWMRRVAGRLKSDYRYSGGVVYNNFIWPNPTEGAAAEVETYAQSVLDSRAAYPDSTIAEMYDPNNDFLFPLLNNAHKALDKAVETAYEVDFKGNEQMIVEHLFNLYANSAAQH